PNVTGSGPTWLFNIDTLTKTMNYQPVTACNQSNPSAGVQEQFDAEKAGEEIEQQYVLFPVWSSSSTNPQNTDGDAAFDKKELEFDEKKPESEVNVSPKFEDFSDNSINEDNTVGTLVPTVGNKKDERGIVVRNKARLVAQGHTQEEGIDYKEVFPPVGRIEAIRLFLAYASFTGFMVYQMDVKSAFLYGTIQEEVYDCQPLGFEDPD
nr:putative ribonuclease H-like domain-containing protein [Tanacetum cinerariifolium]